MSFDHSGRVALVTGGGAGIGRAICRRLAHEGAAIAVVDRDPEAAAQTVQLITSAGGRAAPYAADVRYRDQIRAARDGVLSDLGPITYLVNNAGMVTMRSLFDLPEDEWDLVLDVNLKGMFLVTQEVAPAIAEAGGGAVVCMSTIESQVVVSSQGHCQVHYVASKGGVRMLVKGLAVELAAHGIRVNGIAPGPVDTGFIPGLDPHAPEAEAFRNERLLIKRLGRPEDIAAAASFLLSDDAGYVTGVQLPVDGGWLAR
jgi:NAD(P)-dependent dehydrogenase (short-subunit alcohol dehydrogenase family)